MKAQNKLAGKLEKLEGKRPREGRKIDMRRMPKLYSLYS
jgi:hypothetical protein